MTPKKHAAASSKSPRAAELSGPVHQVDLRDEVQELRRDTNYRRVGRNSKTLVKHEDFRAVLTVLRKGARLEEHRAAGRLSIQVLSGGLSIQLPEGVRTLMAGQWLALDRCLVHDVAASRDSAFLLTLSWPSEDNVQTCRAHQGGR